MLVIVSCMMVLVRLSLRIVIDILHIGRKCGEMLRLKMKQDLSQEDIEVHIRYAKMDQDVQRLVSLIQSVDARIKCEMNGNERFVNASDIYYIESVDKKAFVYCENEVYRTEFRLYQLMEILDGLGFAQISKSCILNINTLDSIKPLLNSRMEATLKNGERLHVTRKYLTNIKRELQGGA